MVKPFSPTPFLKLCLFNPSRSPKKPTPTLFQILHFSTSHSSPGPAHPSRRHEEESRNVRVAVWWDFENCSLPNGVNVFKVAHSITAAIRANGIKGPIQITAFGDVMQLSRSSQEALSSTGVNLTHIPRGGKNSADRSLLVDLMYWVSQNPPPAHLFLISGDRDFAGILHRLRMNNYNILLATLESAPGVLCGAASIMWQWNALLRGENLAGKHFNQPPDGPYGSWYGHYRAPLEDPFVVHEQPSCPRVEELSESGPDPKLRPIPKSVMKQIRHILYSYPKGIPITDLRSELAKSNVGIDKDFYGYKKFSRFLLAMPQILRLQSVNDGQFLVRGITPKVPEENESISSTVSASVSNSGELDSVSVHNLNGEKTSATESMDEKLSLPAVQEPKMRSPPTKLQEPKQVHGLPKPYTEGVGEKLSPLLSPESKAESLSRSEELRKLQEPRGEAQELPREAQESSPSVQVVDNDEVKKNQFCAAEEHRSASEPGIFKRIWKKWFGSEVRVMQGKESIETVKNSGQKVNTEEKDVKLSRHSADSIAPPVSSSSEMVITDEQFAESSAMTIDKSTRAPSVFSQMMSWFRSWTSSQDSDGSCENSSGEMNPAKLDSSSEQLFSRESFWNEMQSFLDTPHGSALVMQSRTRVQMAQNFRTNGPLILGSLSDDDLLQLVDLLISDKKWVEECAFLTSPFKLTRTTVEDTSRSTPHCSSGLSSIFLDIETQSNSLKKQEPNGDKKYQNSPIGISQPFNLEKSCGKSRKEILADCQRIVEFIVKEYPEGFNMGSFRRLFLERYGYPLEIQKLGYQKLATLLQIMPGVRIESTYILPSGKGFASPGQDIAGPSAGDANVGLVANLDNELSDVSRKDDDIESPWDELGPIADADSKEEAGAALHDKAKHEASKEVNHDYELLSDDDFSDSEDETLSSTRSEDDKQHRAQEVDSSLLQILSAWYGSQEGTNRKDKPDIGGDGPGDYAKNSSAPSATAGVAAENETTKSKYRTSKRLSKSYSFVADQHGDDKDKLIDVILGRCKKTGERSAETKM